MRPSERIVPFVSKVFGDHKLEDVITKIYNLDGKYYHPDLYYMEDDVLTFWLDHPDLRFSQVLIALDILENEPGLWFYTEDSDVLESLGYPDREILLWGQCFDKDMNRLAKTIYRPISELDTDHIKAIVDGGWCRSERYLKAFDDELKYRVDNLNPD